MHRSCHPSSLLGGVLRTAGWLSVCRAVHLAVHSRSGVSYFHPPVPSVQFLSVPREDMCFLCIEGLRYEIEDQSGRKVGACFCLYAPYTATGRSDRFRVGPSSLGDMAGEPNKPVKLDIGPAQLTDSTYLSTQRLQRAPVAATSRQRLWEILHRSRST